MGFFCHIMLLGAVALLCGTSLSQAKYVRTFVTVCQSVCLALRQLTVIDSDQTLWCRQSKSRSMTEREPTLATGSSLRITTLSSLQTPMQSRGFPPNLPYLMLMVWALTVNIRFIGTFADVQQELVWSGAPLGPWQHVNDFKPSPFGEFSMLSEGTLKGSVPSGATPIIFNSSLQISSPIVLPASNFTIDPHEFQFAEHGDTFVVKVSDRESQVRYHGLGVVDDHIYEINRTTGDVIFEWRSLDHIPISESSILHTPFGAKDPINYL